MASASEADGVGRRFGRTVHEDSDPGAPPTDSQPLSSTERRTLVDLAEVLGGGRPLLPIEREDILSHITQRETASSEMLAVYRETAALLNRLAEVPFSALPFSKRRELVARQNHVPFRRGTQLSDDAAHTKSVTVALDLIAAYYGTSVGWAVVGYGVFPGRCGDLVRYTHPES